MVLCACAGLIVGGVLANGVILATSNPIHVTVSQIPYNVTLSVNGTSPTNYTGVIYPGDTLSLIATSTPQQSVGKTLTFYANNTALGSGTVPANGVVSATWIVPTLTTPLTHDTYDLSAKLS